MNLDSICNGDSQEALQIDDYKSAFPRSDTDQLIDIADLC
jgi:hypothetical protein